MTKCAAISAIFPVTIIPFSSCTDKQKKSKNEEEGMIVCENSARKKEMKVKYIESEIKNRNLGFPKMKESSLELNIIKK